MLSIGSYQLQSRLLLAPMAGITDLPFRDICRHFGAGMVVSEMLAADTNLWTSKKSRTRLPNRQEAEPRSTQIAGTDPEVMANAAVQSVRLGAQVIDINMGCPAKKVCNKAAGSALLKDTGLVKAILEAVVSAVDVPVTLKFRTGWSESAKNATFVAKLAEDCGIAAIALHGRTRADKFRGMAEYETIRQVKQSTSIPVIANGDIRNPDDAAYILDYTQADGLMIGRSAWGQPWIFEQLRAFLDEGKLTDLPDVHIRTRVVVDHIRAIHDFYGVEAGLRIARKHIGWYLDRITNESDHKNRMFAITCPNKQLSAVTDTYLSAARANIKKGYMK